MLVAGLLLSITRFTQGWILTSLILYIIVLVIGLGILRPNLARLMALAEQLGEASQDQLQSEFTARSRRQTQGILVLGLLVIIILILMVLKPF